MVLDSQFGSVMSSQEGGEKRPFEARKLSYQKMQESTSGAFEAKKSAGGGSGASGNKHGSWGPVFKNRQNFNDMHMF